jgi:hypothetical protein
MVLTAMGLGIFIIAMMLAPRLHPHAGAERSAAPDSLPSPA